MTDALALTDDASLESAMRLANQLIHARNMIPSHIQHPGEVLGIILTGRELGMPPMMALRSISFLNGKPVMDAAAQLGLMRGRGARHRWLTASDDAERASIELTREGDEPYVSTFTMEMAKKMGLAGKPNWQKMPAQMLRARAITAGLRAWMPEAMAGVFDPEELEPRHQEPQQQRRELHVESRPALVAGTVPGGGTELVRGGYVEVSEGGGPFAASTPAQLPATSQAGSQASPTSTTASTTDVQVQGKAVERTVTDVLADINRCNDLSKLDALIKEARGWYKRLPPALQHEVTVVCKAAPDAVAEREALRKEDERAERELQARADAALAYPAGEGVLEVEEGGGAAAGEEGALEPGSNDEPDPADLGDAQAEQLKRDEVGAPDPMEGVF